MDRAHALAVRGGLRDGVILALRGQSVLGPMRPVAIATALEFMTLTTTISHHAYKSSLKLSNPKTRTAMIALAATLTLSFSLIPGKGVLPFLVAELCELPAPHFRTKRTPTSTLALTLTEV